MDPISQGVVGALIPQAIMRRSQVLAVGMMGALSGMAPDLDVLIRSNTDPLLFLEYHRHFTHSIIFIPVGALLCSWVLHPLIGKRYQLSFIHSLLACLLGYASHGLLDACTSYGTMLLWPFNDSRLAWNIISVVDPALTLPALLATATASYYNRRSFALLGIIWLALYLTLAIAQRERAETVGMALAKERGHQPQELAAKPSFANILVWKIVYQTNTDFYVDAVRVGIEPQVYIGQHISKLEPKRDLPWLKPGSQQAKDLARFRWFSNGYIAQSPSDPLQIIDIRYSAVPNEIAALWSVTLKPNAAKHEHVDYQNHRDNSPATRRRFWQMLGG